MNTSMDIMCQFYVLGGMTLSISAEPNQFTKSKSIHFLYKKYHKHYTFSNISRIFNAVRCFVRCYILDLKFVYELQTCHSVGVWRNRRVVRVSNRTRSIQKECILSCNHYCHLDLSFLKPHWWKLYLKSMLIQENHFHCF